MFYGANAFIVIFVLMGLIKAKPYMAFWPFMGGILGSLTFVSLGQDGFLSTETGFNSAGAAIYATSSPYPTDLILVTTTVAGFLFAILIAADLLK